MENVHEQNQRRFEAITLEDRRSLADSEVDAVSGGTVPSLGRMIDARKGGAIIVYDYEGGAAR